MPTIDKTRLRARLRTLAGSTALITLGLGITACSDDAGESPDEPSTTLELEAASILDAHVERQEFPGAVLALHDPTRGDALVTSGTARPGAEASPIDPDVPWGAGSITKTFVAVVVLQLAEEGLLDLDASIDAHFPALPRAAEITARQLLQHTSGIREYFESPEVVANLQRVWSPEELVDAAVALGPAGEPGSGYHYSNTNYILLGQLITQLTGHGWYEEVDARVLQPLGMQHTHYIGHGSAPPIGAGFVIENGTFVDHTQSDDPSTGDSAGGLQSTAPDLLRFARALLEGSLLDEASQAAMRAFIPGEPQGYVSHEYGLGLERYGANELSIDGHLGTSAAHAGFIGFDPESRTAVAVLINAAEPAPSAFMAFEVVGMLTGKDIGPPPEANARAAAAP